MDPNNLVIKLASELQAREVVARNAAHWGARAGISGEDWIKLEAQLWVGEYARDGRRGVWVLVPANNPESTDFYASCQVFTREVLVLYPGQTIAISEFGHAISTVLTPPQHRGRGYGRHLMTLLHGALAPLRYPHLQTSVLPSHPSSTVSVLYSSVGNFYASCSPSLGESGWTVQRATKTVWTVGSINDFTADSSPAAPISESDLASRLSLDDKLIPADLIELQKSDPTKTYFAFVPTAPLNSLSLTLSKLTSRCSPNVPWGAQVPETDDFIAWIYEIRATRKLIVNRLRASVSSFPALLEATLLAARENNCETVEVWNLPKDLVEVARVTGGESIERLDLLSAFKWYGKGCGSEGNVVWALDEHYAWC